jgi:hypothetical protein
VRSDLKSDFASAANDSTYSSVARWGVVIHGVLLVALASSIRTSGATPRAVDKRASVILARSSQLETSELLVRVAPYSYENSSTELQ